MYFSIKHRKTSGDVVGTNRKSLATAASGSECMYTDMEISPMK